MNDEAETAHIARWRAILLAALFAAIVFARMAFLAQEGVLAHVDELSTAERSREMLLLGRSAVYENFQVSAVKPPLQYWLTTLTLPRFEKPEMAVRVWPLLYGMITTAAVGVLAFLSDRSRPWLIPLSIFVVLSCPLFLVEACRGLLDLGLSCFVTFAIVFAQFARKRPVWWLGVAACAWLGALQKTPLVFLIWLMLLMVRLFSPSERAGLRSGWLALSFVLALGLQAMWPLWQMHEFRVSISEALRLQEAMTLGGPERLGVKPYLLVPFRVMTTWPAGSFAFVAALLLPRMLRSGSRPLITELSVVSLGVIAFLVICNFRNARYAVPILPCLSVLLALLMTWFYEQRKRPFKWLLYFALSASLAGFEVSRRTINSRREDFRDERAMAEMLRNLQEKDSQTILLEAQVGDYIPPVRLLPVPFYLFYGDLRFPVTNHTLATFRKAEPRRNCIGVCDRRHFSFVREKYPDAVVKLAQGDFICWATPK